ncbi:hypothetical protein SAMN03097699_2275 [Flavobacteriaceae bacterium MAR_2010_188]|nr:hypothetical protein SAMN03097699_2275 [Flavobacteriaceae bacterium MAR_2010_188]
MNFKQLLFCFLLLCAVTKGHGQDNEQEKDSTDIYEKLENYSKERKFAKFFHRLIFKSKPTDKPRKSKKKKKNNYKPLEGKIIRNIEIDVRDPFGFSFTDSTQKPNSWLEKTGNQIHIKSRRFTIKNLLLFKKNSPLDTLIMSESERLIRSRNYVRSVEIVPHLVAAGSDSVDVKVRVLDSWSIIPKGSFTSSRTTLRVKERNFVGLGHEFNTSVTHSLIDGDKSYDFRYSINNFKNTFINTTVGYRNNLQNYYSKFINVDRPFYSPLTKWAAGVYLDEQYYQDSLQITPIQLKNENINYKTIDVWAGHAFQLFKGNTENERTTNLITSLGYLNVDYSRTSSFETDSLRYYSSEKFYLASVGISSRQFVEDQYIFRDGRVEDVPIGSIYAITVGSQNKNNQDRLYLGARIGIGKYYNWGYLSTNFEYGTFVKDAKTVQTAYSFQANYFTDLISLGENWSMRQFIKPQFLIGTNRLDTPADKLTINGSRPFDGFNNLDYKKRNEARVPGFNGELIGTKKFVLGLQTQFYSPWEVLGFRLNPYLNVTSALIADEETKISKSKLYSSFGLGFIIRNDYLVFSTFQISVAYYPNIPGRGTNIFKTNSFETEDFGFQRFELGKPQPIIYD